MNNSATAQGQLWVIAAPSGAGKTSLVNALVKKVENLLISISYTTRAPRPSEQDGVNYFFISEQQFKQMISAEDLLEYANVFGNYYGTGRTWVSEQLKAGIDVILEIDWQGAAQIRELMPDSHSIFILPPSLEVLETRLHGRGEDKPEVIQKRLAEASLEMSHCDEFDYIVINDQFEQALAELEIIITAQRLISERQMQRYGHLIKNLQQ